MTDTSTNKQLLRAVIRKVHPDIFNSLPFERTQNSESLKLLNQYVDRLSQPWNPPEAVDLSFWVKGALQLELVHARLDGSLANLYLAFGLITEEECQQMRSSQSQLGSDDRVLLDWLRDTVTNAVATADEHETLKKLVREMKARAEYRSGLAAVRLGNSYSSSSTDLKRQLECLRVLDAFLLDEDLQAYKGLTFHLYHPHSAPSQTYHWIDPNGDFRMEASSMNAHVAADGCMHVIADRSTFKSQIATLNLSHARALVGVNDFWGKRQRDLTPALRDVLKVQNIWCDNRTSENQEQFVLWAGRILNAKQVFEEELSGRRFKFSVLVHTDETCPLIDYMSTSSVLQIRADCAPRLLQEFLSSDTADEADEAAESAKGLHDEEEQILQEVKAAFGAKHVIRVCSTEDKPKAMAAAKRLVQEAAAIKGQVDLTNASIAIDDCYQVWESGFISIPFNFEVSELRPKLALLMAPKGPPTPEPTAPAQAASANGRDYAHISYDEAHHSLDDWPQENGDTAASRSDVSAAYSSGFGGQHADNGHLNYDGSRESQDTDFGRISYDETQHIYQSDSVLAAAELNQFSTLAPERDTAGSPGGSRCIARAPVAQFAPALGRPVAARKGLVFLTQLRLRPQLRRPL